MENCLIDKKGKKWVISGYYFDGDQAWTLLHLLDDWKKTKKIKGVI
jgi:hypothetical protein